MEQNKKMPPIFLGTGPFHEIGRYNFKRIRTIAAIITGIHRGYGIDCAVAYGNHRQVGRGIRASGQKRNEIFITSKLYNTQQDNNISRHYTDICKELEVGYLDLLLLHWPQAGTYINAWKQMEELYFSKRVGYIGIANTEMRHLSEIEKKCQLLPQVVQIERNPLNTQEDLTLYCREKQIYMQAYAPIGRMNRRLTEQTCLKRLAGKYEKSVPQIILKWQVQTGAIPVVRSIRKKRIIENIDIWDFEMKDKEIEEITGLNENYKIYDPRRYVRYY